ncbi:MAG TPA: dihydroorotate dehydrogenase-like protein [Bacteroides sp.]|nr:dihydroorotate dehydrogenase-like protein [Bacteroides sp.]
MIDLSTTYAGMTLKSPFIVSSSGLTSSIERIRKMASAGAGGVVLKSLFEEQIMHEIGSMSEGGSHTEAEDYLRAYTRENSLDNYLALIRGARDTVDIPVMASINCVKAREWVEFAGQIQEAGADALELNIYFLPVDKDKNPRDYEAAYLDVAAGVIKQVSIPVIVKLGDGFSSITWMVDQLYKRGVAAVVLFNRFYTPDIDTDNLTIGSSEVLSSPADIRHSLRWVGIISSRIGKMDIAASTGVHSGMAAVKQILAGADAVQVCSVLYRNGIDYLRDMVAEMRKWMEKRGYDSLNDFRGKMNYSNMKDPSVYERSQFIRYFSRMH